MTTCPEVSVLIVSYRSAATIAPCLASIAAEARRIPLEAIVVDNASGDGTVEDVRRHFPWVQVLAEPVNRGFAAGCNRAAQAARGRFLCLLNPDAELRPLALVELGRACREDPGIGALGARVVAADGRAELSFGPHPGLLAEAWQLALGRAHARGLRPVSSAVEWMTRRCHDPDWVSGACLFVPADLYRQLGGLDERYFLYFEDADFCARVRAQGRAVRFWPRSEVLHRRGVSAKTDPGRARLEYRRSQLTFYRRHHGEPAQRALALLLEAKLTIAQLAAWAGGRPEESAITRDLLALVRSYR